MCCNWTSGTGQTWEGGGWNPGTQQAEGEVYNKKEMALKDWNCEFLHVLSPVTLCYCWRFKWLMETGIQVIDMGGGRWWEFPVYNFILPYSICYFHSVWLKMEVWMTLSLLSVTAFGNTSRLCFSFLWIHIFSQKYRSWKKRIRKIRPVILYQWKITGITATVWLCVYDLGRSSLSLLIGRYCKEKRIDQNQLHSWTWVIQNTFLFGELQDGGPRKEASEEFGK